MDRDRAIIEHAADAFFVYDAGGSIFDVNRQACETLGYTREELLSLCMTDVEAILLARGHRRVVAAAGLRGTRNDGRAQRRKDGTAFPVEIRVGLLGEVEGRRLALSIARDISGRKDRHEVYDPPRTGSARAYIHDRLTWVSGPGIRRRSTGGKYLLGGE